MKMNMKAKYHLVWIIASGFVTLYFAKYFMYDHNSWRYHMGPFVHYTENKTKYAIYTSGCKIPEVDPFSDDIMKLVSPITLNCTTIPPLVIKEGSTIQINYGSLHYHNINDPNRLQCCYEKIARVTQDPNSYDRSADNEYRTVGSCIVFTSSATIEHDWIRIRCKYKNKEVYRRHYAYPQVSQFVEKKMAQAHKLFEKTTRPLSLLLIGLDSVSRAQSRRILPDAIHYLKKQGAIEFKGYTKVEENTWPNLSVLLTGYFEEQLERFCWPRQLSKLDSCPFIWEAFSKKGYITAYGEDLTYRGNFNNEKTGFVEQPTDYYLRPLFLSAEKELPAIQMNSLKVCFGDRLAADILNEYTLDFTWKFRNNPYFAFFWTTSLTHDDVNTGYIAGEPYYQLLKKLFEGEGRSDAMNNTVVLFFSDHGLRYGRIRETMGGWMEESLPMLFLWLPPWFRRAYPEETANVAINSKRLTSTFDVYETLRDILDTADSEPLPEPRSKHGVSLFKSIPPSRSCQEAGISQQWCKCRAFTAVDPSQSVVKDAVAYSLSQLNDLISANKHCASLSTKSIVGAYRYGPETCDGDLKAQTYVVNFHTDPGSAHFQAECIHTPKTQQFRMVGDVLRINSYGNQSACVSDTDLKKFCFCTDMKLQ